ncbi:splicing factor 3A subunit 3 [Orycteropus afer afer]|uniref:Splicing factor 3A subunit 3 n=1 Tax=Orycteropus afer afer TaxID=1230840 RepID=A0A8B7AEG1_ORYAF|nr:splicing factor 3A subunit 3 [Orycteropus afer afer]
METILEQQRRYHEEKERLMDVMAKEMLTKKSTLRDQINSDHRTRAMEDRYMEVSGNLKDLYDDKDGLRKEELNAISGPNEFAEFYNRLKQIKEFHRKHPNEICVPMSVEFEELLKARENPSEEAQNLVEFTDEEGYGRYLDLHDCYLKYINLKASEKLDYITYLSIFDQLFDIPKERKNAEYKRYLEMLLEYLQDYTDRVKPLQDQNELFGKIQTEFEKKWENGTFPGWPKETSSALTHAGAHLDLSAFSSWEELASLGLDRLKSALLALGLKCGGTLEERAQRLFSTKGKSLESLDTSLFAKNPKSKGTKRDTERNKDIAFLEAQIYEYVEILGEQRHLTHENVQRKQARTGEEREEEEEEQISESESEDEENEIIYNPKNLPLGWDGKPIPYWLYKLHGLNINYNCEICGNYTYRGPKAFQRHFAEWRHAHGMRCLGIPNTAHFANVTQIEDAVSLWAKLKLQKASERWQPDTERFLGYNLATPPKFYSVGQLVPFLLERRRSACTPTFTRGDAARWPQCAHQPARTKLPPPVRPRRAGPRAAEGASGARESDAGCSRGACSCILAFFGKKLAAKRTDPGPPPLIPGKRRKRAKGLSPDYGSGRSAQRDLRKAVFRGGDLYRREPPPLLQLSVRNPRLRLPQKEEKTYASSREAG